MKKIINLIAIGVVLSVTGCSSSGPDVSSPEFQARLAAAKAKREATEKDPKYIARLEQIKIDAKRNEEEYKAEQERQRKINNDPRVVAARIQANAQLQRALMEKEARDRAATQQALQNLNQSLYNMTPKTYNVNVYHY